MVFVAGIFFLFLYALSPKSKFILKGGKLNNPEFKNQKKHIELFLRGAISLFTLSLIFFFVLPFGADILWISRGVEQPVRLSGKVVQNTTTFGAWFISQRLKISGESTNDDYYTLLYSLNHLSKDQKYDFILLKRSKLVLAVNSLQ